MKIKRHEVIGIKQAIRFEWMQKTANLLIAELSAQTIRHKLHEFLADRKGNGSEGQRSDRTKTFAVNKPNENLGIPRPGADSPSGCITGVSEGTSDSGAGCALGNDRCDLPILVQHSSAKPGAC